MVEVVAYVHHHCRPYSAEVFVQLVRVFFKLEQFCENFDELSPLCDEIARFLFAKLRLRYSSAQVVQSSHEVFMLDEWLSFRSPHYLCDTLVSAAVSHLLLDDLTDACFVVRLPFRRFES